MNGALSLLGGLMGGGGADQTQQGGGRSYQGYGGISNAQRFSDPLYYGTGTIYDSKGNATTPELLANGLKTDPNGVLDSMRNEWGYQDQNGQWQVRSGQSPNSGPMYGGQQQQAFQGGVGLDSSTGLMSSLMSYFGV